MNLARSVIVAGTCIAGLGAAPPALATVTFAAPVALAGGSASESVAVDGSKRVRCVRGQVRVRVVGRTTCRPLRKAVPKPSVGDPRLAFLDAALAPSVRGLRDRRGRRLLTPAKLGGRPGAAARRGIRVLRRVTPKVLARLDALGKRGRASAVAGASADCSAGPSITSNETVGGADVSLTLGNSARATMGVPVGAYRIVAKFDLASPCDRFDAPACPPTDGVLEGSDTKRFSASVTVLHGSDVVSSTSVEMADRMKLTGQVADDAKLDTLDITDRAEYSVRTQAVTIRATIKRAALQINMRTGGYEPSRASVDVQLFTHGGVDQSDSAKHEQANSLADEYDKSFSKIVSQEIANYRSLENAWQAPGACAKLVFDRASGALPPLSKGQTGQVTGHVVTNSDGGTARSGTWTVVDADNGTITPASAAGALPVFSWTVTNTGDGIKLKGDFKATSTAGVADGTWTQPTKRLDSVVRIVGSFSGSLDWDPGDGRERWSWGGSATFGPRNTDQPGASGHYPLAAGWVTYTMTFTASGPGQFGGCSAQGSVTKQITDQELADQGWFGGWVVISTAEDGLSPPYEYSGRIASLSTEASQMAVTRHTCPDPADNGTTDFIDIPLPLSATGFDANATSPDGLTYAGTLDTAPAMGAPVVWHWDFHGETM
jgi:hypothetical protein